MVGGPVLGKGALMWWYGYMIKRNHLCRYSTFQLASKTLLRKGSPLTKLSFAISFILLSSIIFGLKISHGHVRVSPSCSERPRYKAAFIQPKKVEQWILPTYLDFF